MPIKTNTSPVRLSILIVTLFLSYHRVSAQNMMAKPFYTERSHPSANISKIAEDNEGFLWYVTDDGLWRDDGYRVDAFRNDGSNPQQWKSNNILNIACSENGLVWVATDNDLFYIDKKDYHAVSVRHKLLEGRRINHISLANDGTTWVVAGRYTLHMTGRGKLIKSYKALNPGDGNKFVNALYSDSRSNLWMTECRGGMLRYNPQTDHFDRCEWPADCEPYGGMYEDKRNGCLWVATWGKGIVKYVPVGTGTRGEVTFQPCTYEGDNSKGLIISMQERAGTLWCSAMNGMYAYDITPKGELTPHFIGNLIPKGKNIFATLLKDRNDNILVASHSPRPFIIHPQDNSIQRHTLPGVLNATGMEMVATDACIDDNGYIWLWHLRFGIVLYNPQTGECNIAQNLLKWDLQTHLMEKKHHGNGVWTNEGKDIYHVWNEGMNIQCIKVTTLSDVPISLYDDGKGRLWIATRDGLLYYDEDTGSLTRFSSIAKNLAKMRLSTDGQYLYYLTDPQGMDKVDIRTGKVSRISDDTFTHLDINSKGELWASTNLGSVFSIKEAAGKFAFNKELELDNCDAILSFAFDADSHVWVLTNKYVREYTPRGNNGRTLHSLDPEIGLDFFQFMQRSGNHIYVGGAGGYCRIGSFTSQDNKGGRKSPVVSSVIIDGAKHIIGSSTSAMTLSPSNINVEVNFSTLNHLQQHNIAYAYCLHSTGTQPEKWTTLPAGQATAYFSGLSKGDYTISIKATDEAGNWGNEYTDFGIHRLPSWWETWWMYIIYAILTVSLIVYILHFYFRNELQRLEIEKLLALAKELRQSQARDMALRQDNANMVKSAESADTDTPADSSSSATAPDIAAPAQLSKSDLQFVKKAKEKVEQNMTNTNYTTELFASDMCMSRMSLYRRIQRITGQTPTEFIRMIRLHAAAEILKDDDVPVADVAYRVGFATPSYFSKCFKDAFGVLPTEYRRK